MTARPHVPHRTVAPPACTGMCVDDRAGHATGLLRLRLAHLAPDGWEDALVAASDEDGTIHLTGWAEGATARLWHHVARPDLLTEGAPVALHRAHGLLAVGDARLSVALLQ